jgi:hypothetical protein
MGVTTESGLFSAGAVSQAVKRQREPASNRLTNGMGRSFDMMVVECEVKMGNLGGWRKRGFPEEEYSSEGHLLGPRQVKNDVQPDV